MISLTVLVALAGASVARAAEEAEGVSHLFNATLSLTGNCATSEADPVPDPGCPEVSHPPEGKLVWPSGVATDLYGDIYVVNNNTVKGGKETFHVDIFDSTGRYITEITKTGSEEVGNHGNVAVDSTGHLYLFFVAGAPELIRYDPTVYNPEAGEIAYGSPPVTISTENKTFTGLAVDPTNDHLYARAQAAPAVSEYAAAVDGLPNELLHQSIGAGTLNHESFGGSSIALDASRHRIYVADVIGSNPPEEAMVRVFSTEAPYELLETIDGSMVPAGQFVTKLGSRLPLAVDESTGEVIVGDTSGKKIYVFEEDGEYVETINKNPPFEWDFVSFTVDNSPESPNQGFLFVPSGATTGGAGHLFAYEPIAAPKPPKVEAVSAADVGEEEAILHATINPKSAVTHYVLEFVTQQAFEAEGFEGAQVAGEGSLKASNEGKDVFAPATGLVPGTEYRFRAVAENQCEPGGCAGELHGTFTTFAPYAQSGSCPNQALRTGPSVALPDCRAYELVTPADTGGQATYGIGVSGGQQWANPTASPDGQSFAYMTFGNIIPGIPGANAAFNGTGYVADRTASGWRNEALGPDGTQASQSDPGALSPDHGFYTVEADEIGSLVIEEGFTTYVRFPDGSFHLLGEDPFAKVDYLASGGSHILYSSHGTIYDQTPDGVAHPVSVLPGGEATGGAYKGSSADGSAVAFTPIAGSATLYVRLDDEETLEAAPAGAAFAGLSASGRYLFYLEGGDAYRFDTQTEETARITETGDATLVNVSSAGTGVYFLSAEVLGEGPNPNEEEPALGEPNLYYWDGSSTHFVGTVTEGDVKGEETKNNIPLESLGTWTESVGGRMAVLASRTDPQGSVVLFRSRADLTGFKAEGKAEIYRYDAGAGTLRCLSCDPTGGQPGGDASLLSVNPGTGTTDANRHAPPSPFSLVPNLSADGQRAFFQTPERLVPSDNDSLIDVYEWEAQGKGSCANPGGCLFLISSGQSAHDNYLFGASESGDDVFISSTDLLLAEDEDETPSVYDARVGGGFPPPAGIAGECLGEACQPAAVAPNDATPASSTFRGKGNVSKGTAKRRCPKGRHLVRRGAKKRCVRAHHKRHHRNHHHKQAHNKRRAGR